jgi:hypothetical protein
LDTVHLAQQLRSREPPYRRRYIWIPSSQPTLASRKVKCPREGLVARDRQHPTQPDRLPEADAFFCSLCVRSLASSPGLQAPPNQQALSTCSSLSTGPQAPYPAWLGASKPNLPPKKYSKSP